MRGVAWGGVQWRPVALGGVQRCSVARLAGSLDAASLPSLNELLGLVLGPPGSGSLSFIDDEGGSGCHTTIDVCGDPQTQYATLHRLGWPSYPTASELVGHILDRLEYDWALRLLESSLAGEPMPPRSVRRRRRPRRHRARRLRPRGSSILLLRGLAPLVT